VSEDSTCPIVNHLVEPVETVIFSINSCTVEPSVAVLPVRSEINEDV